MTIESHSDDRTGKLQPVFEPAEGAVGFFMNRLAFQTDVADVHAAMESGSPTFLLVDTRGEASWEQGRVPGALHLPTREIASRAPGLLDPDIPVVTYCWGPGCDGATRGALEFARLGHRVKEMIGGYEYWVREGFAVESDLGLERRAADPLTAPPGAVTCDC
jgi:rhodanese-related sulfurtransferase